MMTSTPSPKLLKQRMAQAIAEGNLAGIQEGLATGQRILPAMVCLAAKQKRPAVFEAVLAATKPKIWQAAAQILFAQGDGPTLMDLASATGEPVVGEIVPLVAWAGASDFMRVLVGHFGQEDYFKPLFEAALTAAARNERWDLLRYMVGVADVQTLERHGTACLYGLVSSPTAPFDLVERLIAVNGWQQERLWGDLLIRAADEGCTRFMDFLIGSNMVPATVIAEAAMEAAGSRHDEATALLISKVSLDDLAETIRQQIGADQVSPGDEVRRRYLCRSLDHIGRFVDPSDLAGWGAQFHKEELPVTRARLRALRTENNDAQAGALPVETKRVRARP